MRTPSPEVALAEAHFHARAHDAVCEDDAGPRVSRHGLAACHAEITAGYLRRGIVEGIVTDQSQGAAVLYLQKACGTISQQAKAFQTGTEGDGEKLCRHQSVSELARHFPNTFAAPLAQLPCAAEAPAPEHQSRIHLVRKQGEDYRRSPVSWSYYSHPLCPKPTHVFGGAGL